MTESITGGCICGQVRYRIHSQPKLQLACHCKHCQRQSGSAFSISCLVPRSEFELDGAPKTYSDIGESGNELKRVFCPNCGSAILSEVAARPDAVAVKAGTLDDTSWFKPRLNLWTDSKQDWITIDPECKNFTKNAG